MFTVRVIADDLTGALDTAAPLARRTGPLPVFWQTNMLAGWSGSCALDTGSRDGPAGSPDWLAAFADADLAYKKVDSLLRGNTVGEIAACLASGRFASAVIAPAFPAQQRITRGGRQYWRAAPAQPWEPVACDLAAELRQRGLRLQHVADPARLRDRGWFLCDAMTADDLAALVAAGEGLAAPVLWCGSAGLARALAAVPEQPQAPRLEAPLLVVIGSHHPVTGAQLRALIERQPDSVIRIGLAEAGAETPALDELARRLAGDGRAALVVEVPDGTGAEIAAPFYDRVFAAAVRRLAPPRSLVVTGGATLRRLVGVLEARALLVTGEPLPGVPRSVLQGGLRDGTAVISKSGAFGDPGLLIRLAESAKGGSHD